MKLKQLTVLADLPHSGNGISAVNTRDDLNANDLIDWSDLGQSMTSISNLFSITSSAGRKIDICIPSGNFLRIDQTPSFPGAFNVGDSLLFTGLGNPGPLTVRFDAPIFGTGAQIQSDPAHIPDYIAIVEAFDRFDRSLGKFELSGTSSRIANSDVLFIGLSDRSGSIKKLVFNVREQGVNVPFAINAISLRTNPLVN
ncbi:MAG: PEP-CTERM sorting domain-containing protein [Pseudanabaena sp. CRU_2_10]|nr:PEP-CTERM sorting domain-containing protein [Pseudanabaena sp. CRU_2_10]